MDFLLLESTPHAYLNNGYGRMTDRRDYRDAIASKNLQPLQNISKKALTSCTNNRGCQPLVLLRPISRGADLSFCMYQL